MDEGTSVNLNRLRMIIRERPSLPLLCICVLAVSFMIGCSDDISFEDGPTAGWPTYGNDPGGTRHSPLDQLTPDNVDQLEVAWMHRSGDYYDGSGYSKMTAMQVTPLVVNDLLYYCTPFMRVFALDPESGEERWSLDLGEPLSGSPAFAGGRIFVGGNRGSLFSIRNLPANES